MARKKSGKKPFGKSAKKGVAAVKGKATPVPPPRGIPFGVKTAKNFK